MNDMFTERNCISGPGTLTAKRSVMLSSGWMPMARMFGSSRSEASLLKSRCGAR
jgi:hypothetical protein